MAGLVFLYIFRREILKPPGFVLLLGAGFGFFELHTAIDMLFPHSTVKNVPEEAAKLAASACFTLAVWSTLFGELVRLRRGNPRT